MQKIYSVDKNKRNVFSELWQQQKQPKTIERNKALPDTYDE